MKIWNVIKKNWKLYIALFLVSFFVFGIGGLVISILFDDSRSFFNLLVAAFFVYIAILALLIPNDIKKEKKKHEKDAADKLKEKLLNINKENDDETNEKMNSIIEDIDVILHQNDDSNENEQKIKKLTGELQKIKKLRQEDIIALMTENTNEINDYFKISKSHAKTSFSLAIVTSIVGVLLLILSISFAIIFDKIEVPIITAISGAIAEVFAGILIIHKKSLSQLNHYYNSLHDNERFLSLVFLVNKLSVEKQDEAYFSIIEKEMSIREKALLNSNKPISQ